MIDNDKAVETMIQEKGLTAPRVLPPTIDALMASLIFKIHHFEGTTTMVALAFLPNGFSVGHGQSACASPENFDAEIGARIAVDNACSLARENLWQFEGYALKKQLSAPAPAPVLNFKERMVAEHADLRDKYKRLAAFLATPAFELLDPAEQVRMRHQYDAMLVYAGVLLARIEAF